MLPSGSLLVLSATRRIPEGGGNDSHRYDVLERLVDIHVQLYYIAALDEKEESVSTTKYIINAQFEVDGVVEKPDVVGAIFGQTEGLLGEDLDLRELQKTGRIGRIDISVKSRNGNRTLPLV